VFVIDGDYVSLLQKVDFVGYGTTYVRPNVGGLISSTADWYSNGVLTESQNHAIANWIIGTDKYPEEIIETLPSSMDDSAGDEYTIAGNSWLITNAKTIAYGGRPQRLSLEAHAGSGYALNLFHDSNPDDNQYKWTITKDVNIANAIVYASLGTHYISFTYTIANHVSPAFSTTIRFRKDNAYVPGGTARDYYLLEAPATSTYYQMATGASSATIHHDNGWPLTSPGVTLSTYQGYTQADAQNRTQWFLTHFDNDRLRETGFVATGDDLRRRLYPTGISPYTPPIHYPTLNIVAVSAWRGNQAVTNQITSAGPWALHTSTAGLNGGSGGWGGFSNSDSTALLTGFLDRTYGIALRTASGQFFEHYDKTKFYSITSSFVNTITQQIQVSGLPAGETIRVFHCNYDNMTWAGWNTSHTNWSTNNTGADFFGNGNNSLLEYIELPNGNHTIYILNKGICFIYASTHKP
jgi:hypothetical protein